MLNRASGRMDKMKELLQDEIARSCEGLYQRVDKNDLHYSQLIDGIKDANLKNVVNFQAQIEKLQ